MATAPAQAKKLVLDPAWSRPVAPFRIVDNVYYVGTQGLAAYLIVSDAGAVLLDGTLAGNAPVIERSIGRLGFRLGDVKVLINSHAHFDHAAGFARIKRDTGAQLWISEGDRWAVDHGQQQGDMAYGIVRFPPAKVDAVVHDGQVLHLGHTDLTAMLTPGHTMGCTTWLLTVHDRGQPYQVVFPGSVSVAGNILVGNRTYPHIVADYRASFARLRSVHAQIVLTAHPEVADVLQRHKRLAAGDATAFVDEGQLGRILDDAQADFEKQLAQQTAQARARSALR